MIRIKSRAIRFCCAMLTAFAINLPLQATALTSDSDKPIHIQSNSAESLNNEGLTIYRGNVNVQQGSLRILAEEVTIYSTNNEVNRIIAIGAPAHYQQQPSPEAELVVAEAQKIDYRIEQEILHLSENASLTQQGRLLTGETINYDIRAAAVKASSNNNTSDRVQVVIPPKKKTEASSATPH